MKRNIEVATSEGSGHERALPLGFPTEVWEIVMGMDRNMTYKFHITGLMRADYHVLRFVSKEWHDMIVFLCIRYRIEWNPIDDFLSYVSSPNGKNQKMVTWCFDTWGYKIFPHAIEFYECAIGTDNLESFLWAESKWGYAWMREHSFVWKKAIRYAAMNILNHIYLEEYGGDEGPKTLNPKYADEVIYAIHRAKVPTCNGTYRDLNEEGTKKVVDWFFSRFVVELCRVNKLLANFTDCEDCECNNAFDSGDEEGNWVRRAYPKPRTERKETIEEEEPAPYDSEEDEHDYNEIME